MEFFQNGSTGGFVDGGDILKLDNLSHFSRYDAKVEIGVVQG